MLMPLISCLSPRVRVIRARARVCMRVFVYARVHVHVRTCTLVPARASSTDACKRMIACVFFFSSSTRFSR